MATSVPTCDEWNGEESQNIVKITDDATVLAAADSTNITVVTDHQYLNCSYGPPRPPTGEYFYNTQMYNLDYQEYSNSNIHNQLYDPSWQAYSNTDNGNRINDVQNLASGYNMYNENLDSYNKSATSAPMQCDEIEVDHHNPTSETFKIPDFTPQEFATPSNNERSFDTKPSPKSCETDEHGKNGKSNKKNKTFCCTTCNKWYTSLGHLNRHFELAVHKNAVKLSGQSDRSLLGKNDEDNATVHNQVSVGNTNLKNASAEDILYTELTKSFAFTHTNNVNTLCDNITLTDFDYADLEAFLNNIDNDDKCNTLATPTTCLLNSEAEINKNFEYSKENRSPTTVSANINDNNVEYKCHYCNKVFNKQCYLTQHNNYFHSEIQKAFKCTLCGKRFADEETCKVHIDKHSRSNKPHTCTECPKSYHYKSDLRRHKYQHSGLKPYSCEVCKMSFVRRDHLIKHKQKHAKTHLD